MSEYTIIPNKSKQRALMKSPETHQIDDNKIYKKKYE